MGAARLVNAATRRYHAVAVTAARMTIERTEPGQGPLGELGPPGLSALLEEAWREAGRGREAPPLWRPFDAREATSLAIRWDEPLRSSSMAGFAAVRPYPGTDSIDFFYVRRGARRPPELAALIAACVGELEERGSPEASVLYCGFGWWRARFPRALAQAFERAGFGSFRGIYLGRRLVGAKLPEPPTIPQGYSVEPWGDEHLDAVVDLMEECPEPGAIYWGRDLCRRSIVKAGAPTPPLFPDGTGQLVLRSGGAADRRELCAFSLATQAGYVNHVYTHGAHRGRGLGGAVTVAVLHALARRGLAEATILTHDTNPGALKLYKRIGFREIFRYPQFYFWKRGAVPRV